MNASYATTSLSGLTLARALAIKTFAKNATIVSKPIRTNAPSDVQTLFQQSKVSPSKLSLFVLSALTSVNC